MINRAMDGVGFRVGRSVDVVAGRAMLDVCMMEDGNCWI